MTNRKAAVLALFGAGLTISSAFGATDANQKATGHWEGKIQIPDHELGIALDLAKNSKGVWIGSISVLGTTALDVPVNGLIVDDAALRFEADLPERASFQGRFSAETGTLSGSASNAEGSVPFQLARSGEANVKAPAPSTVLSKDFEGVWHGSLDAGGKVRRIDLKMAPAGEDGTAMATLIVVEQGNQAIRVTTVTINDKHLQLEARSVSGTYRGTLSADGAITGEWAQGPNRVPLAFKRISPETNKP